MHSLSFTKMFTITGDSIIEAAQITKPNEKLRDKLIFGLIIHYLPDIFKFFLSGKTLYLLRKPILQISRMPM